MEREFIISHIEKLVDCIKHERKVDKALTSVGISMEFDGDGPAGELRNYYEGLIWSLILDFRKVPELCGEEFECFTDLIFDLGFESRPDWTAEMIFDYFVNVDQIINDFDIGK